MNNTGGPAFPTKNYQEIQPIAEGYSEGMSLRDWFAGKAMQGIQANPTESACDMDFEQVAEFAYSMANAMLRAREAV